ncbi:glycosyl hydrolase [Umezawaea sp. Da 62-37]|uniref:glycosyl hydrolase n=1 Tax=Umezawaea sp. Da 62-37 TaxID=3075927 RepID=UPI0028F73945|nr:glycosyl hydrolase [Umezawaea sp. Da 62-37]WNV86867.1 glycosyl hydrolase [Umezawaea sp. Da 62-37]
MTRPRSRALAVVGAVLLAVSLLVPTSAQAFPASTRAALIDYLTGISGQYTLSGQHNREPNSDPTKYTRVAQSITGQTPGLWGGDFLFLPDDVSHRQSMVDEAIRQWRAGSVVALTWHFCPPTGGPTCDWETNIKSSLNPTQWSQLVADGTALNTAYKNRLSEAVPYLRQLKDAGVPVLFRPVHEMNEGWSWWGGHPGADGSRKLYQIAHDYFTNTQGFDNLVWVWNVKDVDMGSISQYWPGSAYVDVASLDVWNKLEPSASDYQAMLTIAGGKPIALAEVGKTPTPAVMNAQPRWAWWMVWAEWLTDPKYNTNAGVQASYFAPRVLNRGEFTVPAGGGGGGGTTRTGPITGLGGKCVDVAAANTADGTQVQLYTCNGGTAQQWTVGADGTIRALGKCLDVNGGINADGTKIQLWTCGAGNTHQRWTQNGATLVNPETGRCLDATGQASADGTKLQLWSCNGQTNQNWTLPGTSTQCARAFGAGERTLPVTLAGTTYQVTAYVPAGVANTTALPVVLNLHGSGSTGGGQLSYSDMKAAADRDKYLVVAPSGAIASGSGYVWNVPGVGAPPAGARDDVAFLDQVVSALAAPLCADTTRVYGTGYSGGGRMISAYACARPGRIAAIAPVAGLRAGRPDPQDTTRPDAQSCRPGRGVPVVAFHGQQDNTNPYAGGGSDVWRYSVPAAQQRWAAIGGCGTGPTTSQVSTHVSRSVYSGCGTGADVVLYSVSDGGHTWPGAPTESAGNGTTTREIAANTLMWQFFQRFRLTA